MNKNLLLKESKKFNKGLEEFRGFNQKEWDELDPNLKALIAHKLIISGRGSALFKHIIGVLTNHEKRLKAIEAELGIYTEEEIKKVKVGGTDPD